MRFSCTKENLSQGLAIVNRIKPSNTTLPILNNVLMETQKGALLLSTTNLDMGIKTTIRSKVKEEGSFTIPVQIFSNYINLLPNKQIDIELEKKKGELSVKCDNYQTKIKGANASEFPLIPQVKKDNKFSFEIKDFKRALRQVIITVNPSEVRSEISGILFDLNFPEPQKITLVGTDSYRLGKKTINFNNFEDKENKKIIVPLKTLQELLNLLEDSDQNVEVYFTENQILFSFNDTEIVSRLISGEYPNYQQIIPQDFKTQAICDVNELAKAVKSAGLFSHSSINDIDLEFKKDKIVVSSTNSQIGESRIEVKADISGEENIITFNYRYLIDGLQSLDEDEVYLGIVNSKTAGVIKSPDVEDYLYVVMPIGE